MYKGTKSILLLKKYHSAMANRKNFRSDGEFGSGIWIEIPIDKSTNPQNDVQCLM